MTFRRLSALCVAAGLLLALSACSGVGGQTIEEWIAEQKKEIKPKVEPILPPKAFIPKGYTAYELTDPFNNEKLLQALRRIAAEASASVAILIPERSRKKEQLEDYPLDSITMVGSLSQRGVPVGLVKVNGLLYQVRIGNYLGQNYGRIKSITDSDMTLREIVQDSAGEWIEKETVLNLQTAEDAKAG